MQGEVFGRSIEGEIRGWIERRLMYQAPIVRRRYRCLRATARQVGFVMAVICGIVAIRAFRSTVIRIWVVVAVAVVGGMRFDKRAGRF
jgi:hypothetical protein